VDEGTIRNDVRKNSAESAEKFRTKKRADASEKSAEPVESGLIQPAIGAYLENDRAGSLDRKPRLPEMQKDRNRQAFASKRASI
jgi:hypothetical protein